MSLAGKICFEIAKYRKRKENDWGTPINKSFTNKKSTSENPQSGTTVNPKAFSCADYSEWRDEELRQQFTSNFDPKQIEGKDVLDFGCGYGALSHLVADMGAARVVGIDVLEKDIERARNQSESRSDSKLTPEFLVSTSEETIDLPDNSFDVILCFDVLEHIMQYNKIIPEWKRILRPKGKILIWWQPHFHPYGHHLHNYLPIPWAHVIFSKSSLAEACTRIYNSPEYTPRFWDQDLEGKKRTDKVFDPKYLGGINDLTISQFEKLVEQSGLRISRREAHPFSGPAAIEAVSRLLSKTPKLREFFTAALIYELQQSCEEAGKG